MDSGFMRQWWRVGGLSGIVFLIVFIVAAVAQGETPTFNDPIDEIRAYWVDDGHSYLVTDYFIGLAFVFFFPFLSGLSSYLGQAEGAPNMWSRLVFTGGVVFFVLAAGASFAWTTLAFGDFAEAASDDTILLLMNIDNVAWHSIPLGLAVATSSAGIVILRTRAMPLWLGVYDLVFGILAVITPLAILSDNPDDSPLGFIPFLGAGIWVLATSIVLLMKKEAPVASMAM